MVVGEARAEACERAKWSGVVLLMVERRVAAAESGLVKLVSAVGEPSCDILHVKTVEAVDVTAADVTAEEMFSSPVSKLWYYVLVRCDRAIAASGGDVYLCKEYGRKDEETVRL